MWSHAVMKRTLTLGLVVGLSVALLSPGNVALAVNDDVTVVTLPIKLCPKTIPGIGPRTWTKMKRRSSQAIVVRGYSKRSDENNTELWQRTNSCWVKVSEWWGLNGLNGWRKKPWTGSLLTPMGIFGLTRTGGRKPNPGTAMPYHHGPEYWDKGGYKIHYPKQIYNYVIAMNYNRYINKPPRVTRQPNPKKSSGYWFHQRGLGSTRGCVSMKKKQIREALRWMDPEQNPQAIMGPEKWLAR